MRDRIRALSARLGAPADDRRVIDWVDWAFEQKPGRAIQLTPMMPMPAYVAATQAAPSAAPAPAPPRAPLPPAPRRSLAPILTLVAVVLAALGALAFALTR
jgi:hypothetical protein